MTAIVDPDGPQLCDIASNPVPEGGRVHFFKTGDKVRLRYGIWPKTDGPPRGTVCLVHGRTEFIEKYFETISDFRKRGFTVATFDWRGQGGSERLVPDKPTLGYVDKFEDYWTDLKSFHTDILLPDCPPPYYLVGHSMGGLVGLLAAARDRMMFDRMFLSAPMITIDTPLGMGGMATGFEAACFAGMGKLPLARKGDRSPTADSFPGNVLTSDFARYMRVVDTYAACPDLEISAPAIRWVAAAMRAMNRVAAEDFPDRIKVPVLMLAAAREEVVSTPAIEHLGLRMRTGRHAVVAHARHELFMESDEIRGQVLAAFDAFVTEQSEM